MAVLWIYITIDHCLIIYSHSCA